MKDIQPKKIIQGFETITIGNSFRSDTFYEDIYFSGAKFVLYLLCHMKSMVTFCQRITLLRSHATKHIATTETYLQHCDIGIKTTLYLPLHWNVFTVSQLPFQ